MKCRRSIPMSILVPVLLSALMLSGILCGIASAAKYHGAATLGILVLCVLSWRGGGWRRSVGRNKNFRGKILICLLLLAGWLAGWGGYAAKNWLLTGNPVYPFAAGVFPSLGWTHEAQQAYETELAGISVPFESRLAPEASPDLVAPLSHGAAVTLRRSMIFVAIAARCCGKKSADSY